MLIRTTILYLSLLLIPASLSYAEDDNYVAPDFSLPMLENNAPGAITHLKDFSGKLIYLDFWASWCGPCRQSFPFLQQLRTEYVDQGFEVIAINVDAHISSALGFLEKYPVDYPILLDPNGSSTAGYGVRGLPTAFIINPEGEIVYEHLGFKEKDKQWIRAVIEDHLQQK